MDVLFATVCVMASGVFLLVAIWSFVASIFDGNIFKRYRIVALCLVSSFFFYLAATRVAL